MSLLLQGWISRGGGCLRSGLGYPAVHGVGHLGRGAVGELRDVGGRVLMGCILVLGRLGGLLTGVGFGGLVYGCLVG